jgi:L-asparagine oxygenase
MTTPDRIAASVAVDGFAFLRGYRPDECLASVAPSFGTVVALPGFETVQRLVARTRHEAPLNAYGGNYGYGPLPLHTDLAHWFIPPRYVILRCIVGTANVATLLLDGKDIVSAIGPVALRRALVQPRRPIGGTRALLHVLEQDRVGTDATLRWDELFLVPVPSLRSDTYAAAHQHIRAASPERIMLRDPGDTLVFDNWRMLHGRSATSADDVRVVERVYLGELA